MFPGRNFMHSVSGCRQSHSRCIYMYIFLFRISTEILIKTGFEFPVCILTLRFFFFSLLFPFLFFLSFSRQRTRQMAFDESLLSAFHPKSFSFEMKNQGSWLALVCLRFSWFSRFYALEQIREH